MKPATDTNLTGRLDISLMGLNLDISTDKMTASLLFSGPRIGADDHLDQVELVRKLEEQYGLFALDINAITKAVSTWNSGDAVEGPVVIATGRAPANGVDGDLEWNSEYSGKRVRDTESKSVDYFNLELIPVVKKGDKIAVIRRPTRGVDGIDVYGHVLRAMDGAACPVRVGENLEIKEDGITIAAASDGHVEVAEGRISVKPVLEIAGDVNFDVGKIDFPGKVVIKGNVLDGFTVKAGGDIHVNGMVEAAHLEAGGDIYLKGGASGKNKGVIICKGRLVAKHLDNVHILAGGEIEIQKEAINCTLLTKASIMSPRGSIIGGELKAAKGGEVGVLGSAAYTITKVYIGTDYEAEARIEAIWAETKEIEEKVEEVEALVKKGEYILTLRTTKPEIAHLLREKLTEKQFEITELKAHSDELVIEKTTLHDKLKEIRNGAELRVLKGIFPGVIVNLGNDRQEWEEEHSRRVKISYNMESHEMEVLPY